MVSPTQEVSRNLLYGRACLPYTNTGDETAFIKRNDLVESPTPGFDSEQRS